ncbi:MAG: VIT domain-containing protein [Planctomycetaceae bacterium]
MKTIKNLIWLVVAGCLAFSPTAIRAQGVLIIHNHPTPIRLPRPIPTPAPLPVSYKIKELAFQAKVVDQVAQVQVSQSFVNTGSQNMEVSFVFPLPYDGAIDRMTLLVDGKEYEAKLMPAKEARTIYEGYIRRNQDPALLEWVGTGMFQTSVFPVPAGAERKVTLKFSQLLRKEGTLTDLLIPLATAKYSSTPVEKLVVEASIESTSELKNVYSPTHTIELKRPDPHHATVRLETHNQIPATDFRLLFDASEGKVGASLISYRPNNSEDGYFLLLASPEIKTQETERPAKTVIFVVDRSGSMSGNKFNQAKEALKFVLNNLQAGDTFNIVAYDSNVESFKPEIQKFDDESRKSALGFVEGLFAGGGTNIEGALSTALNMLVDNQRPSYVLFLTDGLPTAGEVNENNILASSTSHNKVRARIINFGVGYDVNSRLLDKIARENFGQSEYIRPDENIELAVGKLYSKISSPVMTEVKVAIDVDATKPEQGPATSRTYPRTVNDLFAGQQLVQVGRYKYHGGAKVTVTGRIGKDDKKLDFPATLVEKSPDQTYAFIEKLWAIRRVGEIIDELDLKGKNDELITELVSLATKHGILTPYTSFLADDQARPGQLASRENLEQARRSLDQLSIAEGRAGVSQRLSKKSLQENATAQNSAIPSYGLLGGAPSPASGPVAGAKASGSGLAANGNPAGLGRFRDAQTDKEVSGEAVVQNVGNTTLYKRGKLLVASSAEKVDPEKDSAKIQVVKRYSEEYFALVKGNSAEENAVLARQQDDEQLLLTLRGQVYRIE